MTQDDVFERALSRCDHDRFGRFGVTVDHRQFGPRAADTMQFDSPAGDLLEVFRQYGKPIAECPLLRPKHRKLAGEDYLLAIMTPKQLFLPFMLDDGTK